MKDDDIVRRKDVELALLDKGQRSRRYKLGETWELDFTEIREALADVPAAQPRRKTGEWQITNAYPHNVYCSVCHEKFAQTHWAVWKDGSLPRNFCPSCGADMREKPRLHITEIEEETND